ncbi:hypothetical protein JOD29_003443 [Lysinibacillus composti]|nr:hypothetical protein [Lysinibacillus composti]
MQKSIIKGYPFNLIDSQGLTFINFYSKISKGFSIYSEVI